MRNSMPKELTFKLPVTNSFYLLQIYFVTEYEQNVDYILFHKIMFTKMIIKYSKLLKYS